MATALLAVIFGLTVISAAANVIRAISEGRPNGNALEIALNVLACAFKGLFVAPALIYLIVVFNR